MKYILSLFLFTFSLNTFSQNSALINNVIEQLNLDVSKLDFQYVSSRMWPNNLDETIVVIPEIEVDSDDYLEFNSYILIVNSETGEITHTYFERSCWVSDAIILSDIIIDTAPYQISENELAFGIKSSYYSRSQPNPYHNSTLSLFVKSGDSLKRVLNFYDVNEYHGEWDTQCAGESESQQKKLSLNSEKSNGYFDILAENRITESKTYVGENGECEDDVDVITTIYTVLKFDGTTYKEAHSYSPIDVYPFNENGNGIVLRDTPKGKEILNLDTIDDYITLTVTEAQYGWLKVIKITGVEGDNVEIPGETGWIHCSDVEVTTRKKIELFTDPERGTKAGTVDQEIGVNIVDKYLNWVEIEYEGIRGWVKSFWLCGNPVSTCP